MAKLNRNLTVPYSPDLHAPWVGFDLDGTLARHKPGSSVSRIGDPVPAMMQRLRQYLALGVRVKIFTARAGDFAQVRLVQQWLVGQGVPPLEVTNKKDYLMLYNYDDRARQVVPNQGVVIGE